MVTNNNSNTTTGKRLRIGRLALQSCQGLYPPSLHEEATLQRMMAQNPSEVSRFYMFCIGGN